jgi:hypothetical protein
VGWGFVTPFEIYEGLSKLVRRAFYLGFRMNHKSPRGGGFRCMKKVQSKKKQNKLIKLISI